MKNYILGLTFAVAMTGTAHAVDAPEPFPTRDVTVQYKDIGGNDPQNFVMNYSAQMKKMRMDIGGSPDFVIMDINAKRNTFVMGEEHAYVEMAAKQSPVRALLPDGVTMARAGDDTVAGQKCTVWNFKSASQSDGTVCVTADGVMLRSHYDDGNNQTTEATAVEYKPQDSSLFMVPKGYTKTEMPAGAQMGVGGGAPVPAMDQ